MAVVQEKQPLFWPHDPRTHTQQGSHVRKGGEELPFQRLTWQGGGDKDSGGPPWDLSPVRVFLARSLQWLLT